MPIRLLLSPLHDIGGSDVDRCFRCLAPPLVEEFRGKGSARLKATSTICCGQKKKTAKKVVFVWSEEND
ncbi:hypothetical protein JTE90_005611 [Oedothorax gibbosus]|uniref:Uncharacterized protein n=1 Tax=Oedothorax gibbosus TaxID=931172 RepID=A0AAV6U199_9ARAC|nr:hypothetical protein JTE90_005611 [Oedothorax gibbosus]